MRRAECAVLSRAGAHALRSLRAKWAGAQFTLPSHHGNRARLRPHGQFLFSGTLLSADPLRSWWAGERDAMVQANQWGVRAVDVADLSAGRWAPRRLRAIWWQEGPHGVFGRALALLGWRRYLVYMRPLDEPVAIPTAMPKVHLNELGPDDLEHYAAFRPGSRSYLYRLRTGYTCFAAWRKGRIVAVTWIAAGAVRVEHLHRTYLLDPDEVCLINSLTAAEQRGQRLSATIFAKIAKTSHERGYRRAVGLIAPYNQSSIRSRERSGFTRIGVVGSFSRSPIRTANFQGRWLSRDSPDGRVPAQMMRDSPHLGKPWWRQPATSVAWGGPISALTLEAREENRHDRWWLPLRRNPLSG